MKFKFSIKKSYPYMIVALMLGGISYTLGCCGVFGDKPSGERLQQIEAADNYKNGVFVNETPRPKRKKPMPRGSLLKRLVWPEDNKPHDDMPTVKTDKNALAKVSAELRFVWFGHAFLLLEIEGKRFMIDPVFGHAAPSYVLHNFHRFQEVALRREDFKDVDAIIISHNHYDHLEASTIEFFADKKIKFFAPLGVGAYLESWGVRKQDIIELNWWQNTRFRGLQIYCTPARHFSGRSYDDRNKSLWASWALIGRKYRVYYGGDGGWDKHFSKIGQRLGPFDLTFLGIGAYSKHWKTNHLAPEEAVNAHIALRGREMMPVHWCSYLLAFHKWDEPIKRCVKAAAEKKIKLLTPQIGEIVVYGAKNDFTQWWRTANNSDKAQNTDNKSTAK